MQHRQLRSRRPRSHRLLAAIGIALALAGAALFGISPVSASAATGCTPRPAANLAAYDAEAARLIAAGQLTPAAADQIRCHPESLAADTVTTVTTVPMAATSADALAAAAVTCPGGGHVKQSANMVMTSGSPASVKLTTTLTWCYDGHRVSNWSGRCQPAVTTWGQVNGWASNGCTTNDFIPYTLSGYYPGGIHHRSIATYVNQFVPFWAITVGPLDIWGHGNGTCDHGNGHTVWHYC